MVCRIIHENFSLSVTFVWENILNLQLNKIYVTSLGLFVIIEIKSPVYFENGWVIQCLFIHDDFGVRLNMTLQMINNDLNSKVIHMYKN